MKKIGSIVLAITIAFFATSIAYYSLKGEKTLTKDEAIALADFTNIKLPEDKNFTTENKNYKNNEQVIYYNKGNPIMSWKFVNVTTKNHEDTEGLSEDGMIQIELEVENINFDVSPSYNPFFDYYSSVYVTDKGNKLIKMSELAFTPLKVGEKNTYTFFMKPEKAQKEINKIYLRYYYADTLLDWPSPYPENHVDFELEVSH